MNDKYVIRFAPSPTGYLHIGGARTALFNYLFAKKNNGKFILRIEDTDRERYVEGSVQQIIDSLRWLGIDWDEGPEEGGENGPYFQSQRLDIYKKYVAGLIESGNAYYCFCSVERLNKMRKLQKQNNEPIRYDKKCLSLSEQEIKNNLENKVRYVIRMKVPESGVSEFNDIIRGTVKRPYENVDDQILLKSDGFPTYHLANVVDDHFMGITYVIRGEEWLSSTPKHLLLYKYFNWEPPKFAHLPLLLNPDKSKLSKRQGDVAVSDYRKKGFLPEAVMNYIALLGWNPGDDREFFKKQELIDNFKLERVNKSGSVFDINKLKWMNGNYIRKLRKTKFGVIINNIKKYLLEAKVIDENFSEKKLELLADMYYEKLNVFSDIIELSSELFNNKFEEFNGNVKNIVQKKEFESVKQIFVDEINNFDKLNSNNLNILVKKIQNNTGVKGHKLYTILRILVSGKDEGPDLLKLFLFLGKDNIVERLKNFDQKN